MIDVDIKKHTEMDVDTRNYGENCLNVEKYGEIDLDSKNYGAIDLDFEHNAGAVEAIQSCVSPKIAAQGSMNALVRNRGKEARHRLTRNAVVFFSRHHAIFLKLQRNILC